jgi:uncharacterized protein with HEPN domain
MHKKIRKYIKTVDKKEFSKYDLLQDAIIRNFEVIGEASKKISPDFKKIYFKIPWKEISGMRDKLIHDYLGVDIEVIWKTIEQDLPILQKGLKKIK